MATHATGTAVLDARARGRGALRKGERMRSLLVSTAALGVLAVAGLSTPARAADLGTATVAGATATAVSPWAPPRGCSQFRVTYANLPPDTVASIRVLDTATRADMGGAFILDTAPRAGTESVQVCRSDAEGVTTMTLQLDVNGEGVGESAPFGWTTTAYATPITPAGWRCGPDVPASPVAQCTVRGTSAAKVARDARRAGLTLRYPPAFVGGRTVVAVVAKAARF